MVKVSVLYPNKPGARFNTEYYLNVHMPLTITRMGSAIKGLSVDIGMAGAQPGEAPPFVAMCHFICDSPEAFNDAFMPNAAEIMGDIPNYTDIAPVIQVSEIKLSR